MNSRQDRKMGLGGCVHRRYQTREEDFVKKKLERVSRGGFTPHSTLSLAPPQRELREAKEDGIKWQNGMYDLEQSSRRNQGIIVNADQSTGGGPRRLLLQFQLQLR